MFNINNDFLLYDFEPEKLGFRLRDFYGKNFGPCAALDFEVVIREDSFNYWEIIFLCHKTKEAPEHFKRSSIQKNLTLKSVIKLSVLINTKTKIKEIFPILDSLCTTLKNMIDNNQNEI